MSLPTAFARDQRGATLVEFALVAPVLILVLVVCLDFARALNAYVTVASASREGARYATVHPTAPPAEIRSYVASRVVPLNTDPSVLIVVPTSAPINDHWTSAAPRPVSTTVTVRYRWEAATGLTASFFSAASGSPWFAVTSTMESIR